MIYWESIFDKVYPVPGASREEVEQFVNSLMEPLSEEEIDEINMGQTNPFPKKDPLHRTYHPFDPRVWVLPNRPLPASYLDFLAWSDGPECVNGERSFGFFGTKQVREYLLCYHVPEYMPLALPFAFNGGGVFYLFDMREEAVDGEYPIVVADAAVLDWEVVPCIATSFIEACSGKINIERILYK
jgi:hypothetical protein